MNFEQMLDAISKYYFVLEHSEAGWYCRVGTDVNDGQYGDTKDQAVEKVYLLLKEKNG